jgi:hypothetical protein
MTHTVPPASLALLWAGIVGVSCTHDWDTYDPRLGEGGASSTSATGGAATTSGDTTTSAGGSTTVSTGGAGGGSTGIGGDGGQGGSPPGTVVYAPSIADCIDPVTPDPDACAIETGPGVITVDTLQNSTGTPRHSFLRFDLDDTLEGKTVDSVTLRLVVPVLVDSESDQTGEVWQVAAFTRPDLFDAAPVKVGSVPLAPDMGAVAQGATVEFDLPVTVAVASGSVFLGLLPLISDGVDYFNLLGAQPPALVIDYH